MVTFGSVQGNIPWGFLLKRHAHCFKEVCYYRKKQQHKMHEKFWKSPDFYLSVHRMSFHTSVNANNVNVIDFPPKTPDLNIIENIWDELNHRARRIGAILTTLNELKATIRYKWNNLPQNYVQRYVTSMRRHCVAVVNSAGGHTRF